MKMRQVVAMVCVVVAHCAFAALPPECACLECIVSTGEQYIDTGIKLKCPDDRVYMKFMCTELGNGGVLFGNRKTASDHCFMAITIIGSKPILRLTSTIQALPAGRIKVRSPI